MTNFVNQYRSTDPGFSAVTGTVGDIISKILDPCLVNGGSTQSVSSLTSSGTTATATVSSTTGLRSGEYHVIAGATPSGYNGTVQITVLNGTQFSYTLATTLTSPATGTITVNKAALGWSKAFSGTNLAVYRSADASYPQPYLRVDDSGATAGAAKEAAARLYATMSDINTGTDPTPTTAQIANGVCWRKSASADSTARSWVLFGDDRAFYFVVNSDASGTAGNFLCGAGSFNTNKSGDGYNNFISGNPNFNVATVSSGQSGPLSGCGFSSTAASNVATGVYVTRGYAQIGSAIPVNSLVPVGSSSASINIGTSATFSIPFPNGPDSGLYVSPLFVAEFPSAALQVRGQFPGLYCHMHSSQPSANFDTVTNVVGLSGVTLTAIAATVSGTAAIIHLDTFGPW